jgi:hypothetical protein
LGQVFWVGVRWLVLSGFGVLALVNIWGLLALVSGGSSAIVEANMVGWNLRIHGSSPAGASRGRTGQFGRTNGHFGWPSPHSGGLLNLAFVPLAGISIHWQTQDCAAK